MNQQDTSQTPMNLEAEQAVLGCVLIENATLASALERLNPEDFYRDAHRHIFEAAMTLMAQGEQADLISLPEALKSRGQLEQCGGFTYLRMLFEAPASTANIRYYAGLVAEKAALRRLRAFGDVCQTAEKDAEKPIVDLLRSLEWDFQKAITLKDTKGKVRTLAEVLAERLVAAETRSTQETTLTGVATGFDELDYMTGGWQPGELAIVAARPSMGKSAIAMQTALYAAQGTELPTLFFSLEMSSGSLVDRLIPSESLVEARGFRLGQLTPDNWESVRNTCQRLRGVPLYLDDTRTHTVMAMLDRAKRLQKQSGLGMVVVDYLQLIKTPRGTGNRVQEVGTIARDLKGMAKELGIPVIALAQLSRQTENRPDKRPQLSDLRESGELEAEADLVVLLHREDYYKKKTNDEVPAFIQTAELIIAKQRNGTTGTAQVGFIPTFVRFEGLAGEEYGNSEGAYEYE